VNYVPYPPAGLILAVQYYDQDEAAAMRLARLIADIEPKRRDDVMLMFCRRYDMPMTGLAWHTFLHCGLKFRVGQLVSGRDGKGHPAGCNELSAGVFDQLAAGWAAGRLGMPSVALLEADGCPLRPDWIDCLLREHAATVEAGKRVTGAFVTTPYQHINGSLIAHLSMWLDRPSLHHTPSEHAWDLFHRAVLTAEARPTSMIRNLYGARGYSDEVLAALALDVAWLASTKDSSAIGWAERTLVAAQATAADPEAPGARVFVQG
jgi:hypothetical protein